MAEGRVTRGTTGTNRLRRVDRWIASLPALRRASDPLVVDLGYGGSATTPLELHSRLARVRPDVEVIGIEIEPARVRLASLSARPGVSFVVGGFEVPLPRGRRATVIRAFNVLRQYNESEVADAWNMMVSRLQPGGVLTEQGPQTFTVSLRLADLERPSIVAERLPKVLIHRNVPGERVHEFLLALDRQWAVHAPLSTYGPSQRWIATVEGMRAAGWPVRGNRSRWRLGELTVDWASVAPNAELAPAT
jgi:hypothetical protein